ncbi:hypothetical protein BKA83DRAFT_4127413 [Pisolithus microcarpus]|nr:hypothetical protein BKA83DRAFT_4127413 [Pisolithus microcarpus]
MKYIRWPLRPATAAPSSGTLLLKMPTVGLDIFPRQKWFLLSVSAMQISACQAGERMGPSVGLDTRSMALLSCMRSQPFVNCYPQLVQCIQYWLPWATLRLANGFPLFGKDFGTRDVQLHPFWHRSQLAATVATTGFRQPNGAKFLLAALRPEVLPRDALLSTTY